MRSWVATARRSGGGAAAAADLGAVARRTGALCVAFLLEVRADAREFLDVIAWPMRLLLKLRTLWGVTTAAYERKYDWMRIPVQTFQPLRSPRRARQRVTVALRTGTVATHWVHRNSPNWVGVGNPCGFAAKCFDSPTAAVAKSSSERECYGSFEFFVATVAPVRLRIPSFTKVSRRVSNTAWSG